MAMVTASQRLLLTVAPREEGLVRDDEGRQREFVRWPRNATQPVAVEAERDLVPEQEEEDAAADREEHALRPEAETAARAWRSKRLPRPEQLNQAHEKMQRSNKEDSESAASHKVSQRGGGAGNVWSHKDAQGGGGAAGGGKPNVSRTQNAVARVIGPTAPKSHTLTHQP